MAQSEADILAMALAPFAVYFKQMEIYGAYHRGRMRPDSDVMAHSQSELGTSAIITIGDFRRAAAALEKFNREISDKYQGVEQRKMHAFHRACGTPTDHDELFT